MSEQERISWAGFVVTALLGVWYFAVVLPLPGDSQLLGPRMAPLIVGIIGIAIVVAIATELLLRWVQKRGGGDPGRHDRPDERDRLIALHAERTAYNVLVVAVAIVLGHIAATQWLGFIQPVAGSAHDTVLMRLAVGPLDGPLIAQLLLLALTLASLCKLVTRIVSYRRGY